MKAVDGFEPTIKLLQSHALPLGYAATTLTIISKFKDKSKNFYSFSDFTPQGKMKSPKHFFLELFFFSQSIIAINLLLFLKLEYVFLGQ